jgi:hypothetical protein
MKRKLGSALIEVLVAVGCIFSLPLSLAADHEVDLVSDNSIPCYCQEGTSWCGPATAQMILQGYPDKNGNPVNHVYPQNLIRPWTQLYNAEPLLWKTGTDPEGMLGTLMELGGDPGVMWIIACDSDRDDTMYDIAYYMTKYRYPTAVLVHAGGTFGSFDHWVVITKLTTDKDPLANSSVNLKKISIFDPGKSSCPTASSGGIKATVKASTWFGTYWKTAGNLPGSVWHGEYVAVVEPPAEPGSALAEEQVFGPAVITAEMALGAALQWIEEEGFAGQADYSSLQTAVPFDPILADPDATYGGAYYIVPFGEDGTNQAAVAVLVNAFTGEAQEIGSFGEPVSYVSEAEASAIAKRRLCLCSREDVQIDATLATFPVEPVFSRFFPIWQVVLTYPDLESCAAANCDFVLDVQVSVWVTFDGQFFRELQPPVPGD